MKAKLLKKLRQRIGLYQRNGEYKVIDNQKCSGDGYGQTDWMPIRAAISVRRDWILQEAKKYKVPKSRKY